MNSEYLQFVPCSNKIVSSYVKQDPDSVKRGQQQFAKTTMAQVCGLASGGCTPTGRFPYSNLTTCTNYMSSLNATQCPFVITGNTAICRNFHALNALADPAVHCPHTAPDSVMCTESCLADCGPARVNTFCDSDFYNITIPHYKRKCSPGFIGDGHTCTPISCTQRYQCPGPYSYSDCNTNTSLCQCLDSFVWNSTTGTCACRVDQNVVWLSSGKPFCVPNGRCITRSDCPQAKAGAYSDVSCLVPVNDFATSNYCMCNYGFDGMFANNCTCNGGKQVKWSDFYQGNVCLASTECTETWHCPWGKACYMNNTDDIGQCA